MKSERMYDTTMREKEELIDAILAYGDFKNALDKYDNTAYKGDALKEVNRTRTILNECIEKVRPIIEKRRNNG